MDSKGFTLLEIIIAVLIIVTICAGMLGSFVGGNQLMSRSRHKTQAMNFARKALDKLRVDYRYDQSQMSALAADNPHGEGEIGGNIILGELTSFPPDAPDRRLTYNVMEASNAYKGVTVSVKWKESNL